MNYKAKLKAVKAEIGELVEARAENYRSYADRARINEQMTERLDDLYKLQRHLQDAQDMDAYIHSDKEKA